MVVVDKDVYLGKEDRMVVQKSRVECTSMTVRELALRTAPEQ